MNYKHSLMKPLARAEEQVMKAVWKINGGLLMEIVAAMPKPQPHKNTVATILKTLHGKGFIEIQAEGRVNHYLPAVSKDDYTKATLTSVAKGYFEGSFANVVSFLLDEKKISAKDLETLLKNVKKK